MRWIGTDNCAVMLSEINGAVQEIPKVARYAKRFPCMNHFFNNSNNLCAVYDVPPRIKP